MLHARIRNGDVPAGLSSGAAGDAPEPDRLAASSTISHDQRSGIRGVRDDVVTDWWALAGKTGRFRTSYSTVVGWYWLGEGRTPRGSESRAVRTTLGQYTPTLVQYQRSTAVPLRSKRVVTATKNERGSHRFTTGGTPVSTLREEGP